MSSFLLSLVSPVLRKTLCGDFAESFSKEIRLEDVTEKHFMTLLWLTCGDDSQKVESIKDLFELGGLAERLEMVAAATHVENILLSELKAASCSELLQSSKVSGLQRIGRESYLLLRDQFNETSKTAGFLELSENVLNELLEDDELGICREEDAYEAAMRWIVANSREGLCGEEFFTKIRFGSMDDNYLHELASTTISVDGLHVGFVRQLVGEALTRKGVQRQDEKIWDGVVRLCDKWLVARKAGGPVLNLSAGTILGAGVLQHPLYLAIDGQGRILVSDLGLHQVVMFNTDGSIARRFGSEGAAAGHFVGPRGVAVDGEGRIVVADRFNHRVQVLNPDGSVARCLGCHGTGVGQLDSPHGVAVDSDGRVVVADGENHRVQVFNLDGTVARVLGSPGAAVGQLNCPAGVAVDRTGRVVVADSGNQRVQVFGRDGAAAVLCFGARGSGPGQFAGPCGVAVDRLGRILVSDCGNNRVQVFGPDGGVVCVHGGAAGPCGVAVDAAGRVVVAEMVAGRVHVL